MPNYTLSEAAYWLALAPNTLSNWVKGKATMAPVVAPARTDPTGLSFWNLVECSVVASITKVHRIPLQRVRTAIEFVRKTLGKDRPLIEQVFQTDGAHLFIEQLDKDPLICASQGGQLAMRAVVAALDRIEWDENGLAQRMSPWRRRPSEPQLITIDSRVAFGQPVMINRNIPVAAIMERFKADESIQSLADDYDVQRDEIERLVRVFVSEAA
tara:strand:- start:2123 stop:2761 length:639 start_codon:yes stop_codon:yes gene_type:complete